MIRCVIAGSAALGSKLAIPMRTFHFVALALSTTLAGPALAQYRASAPAVQPMTTADQLAAVMRRVAAAPTDVFALVSAGELSMKLDDMSAAAAFFARAEKIDPRNGRVKAGMAAILVRAERPGEALRYFQMAENYGHSAMRFASDRGLAYDLLGEQERAQRDYRLALRTGSDDETVRRYALSLGISGKQALALEQIEPLTRRQDRAAWRVRAFVLAMNGDVAGASTIATTMMPRGMAGGLQPFFERLPSLPATDRAFAVHFGEVRPTAARLADARMKPALAALGPDPYAPVQVAARPAGPVVMTAATSDRRRGRSRREPQVAASVARRVAPPVARPVPPPVVASVDRRAVQPVAPAVLASAGRRVPVTTAPTAAPATLRRERVEVAAVAPAAIDAPAAAALQSLAQLDRVGPATASPTYAALDPSQPIVPAPVPAASGAVPRPVVGAALSQAVVPRPADPVQVAATPVATVPLQQPYSLPAAVASAPAQPATALASTVGSAEAVPVASAPGFTSLAPAPVETASITPLPAPVTAVRSEDSILARIVASITIPGEELGVVEPERRVPAVAAVDPATARTLAAGEAKLASQTADRLAAARTIAAAARKPAGDARPGARTGRAAEDTKLASRKERAGRTELAANADADAPAKTRTAAERRAADRKKAADDKAALARAEKAKTKGEPERIWVQVAGGASEGDLPKAWSAAQKKAAALKGRAAYTTPLRATNRVVTGPFKTDAEARAFVNQLAKQGVSAFQFTSTTGQKMTKLSAK
jgi:tetratricopeptide (TPR) repeat protein